MVSSVPASSFRSYRRTTGHNLASNCDFSLDLRVFFLEFFGGGNLGRVARKKHEGTALYQLRDDVVSAPNAQKRLVIRGPGRGPGSGVRANLALGSRGPGHFGAEVPGSGSPWGGARQNFFTDL